VHWHVCRVVAGTALQAFPAARSVASAVLSSLPSLSSSLFPFPPSLSFLPFHTNPRCNDFGSARSREREQDPGRGMKIQGEV
jgi:hypothetical protein